MRFPLSQNLSLGSGDADLHLNAMIIFVLLSVQLGANIQHSTGV